MGAFVAIGIRRTEVFAINDTWFLFILQEHAPGAQTKETGDHPDDHRLPFSELTS
jgi:hypothetical protein